MKISRTLEITCIFFALLGTFACSQNQRNDRDIRREQIRYYAEVKRRELLPLVGEYFGEVSLSNGQKQTSSLLLSLKDTPFNDNGEIDPVLVPELSGYFRFNFGANLDAAEFINFAVTKTEYDKTSEKFNLTVAHSDFKEIFLTLSRDDQNLVGVWNAPIMSLSGSVKLGRSVEAKNSSNASSRTESSFIGGDYGGYLKWSNDSSFQRVQLQLSTSTQAPQGLKLSAAVTLRQGDDSSPEYVVYRYEVNNFNPLTKQILLKDDSSDLSVSGTLENGVIKGDWTVSSLGKIGTFEVSRANNVELKGPLIGKVGDTYAGKLRNDNPNTNLPENISISLLATYDSSAPRQLKTSGHIRFYLDATLYEGFPFSEVFYNHFTRQLIAKTASPNSLTIRGTLQSGTFSGKLYSETYGEVGPFSVERNK